MKKALPLRKRFPFFGLNTTNFRICPIVDTTGFEPWKGPLDLSTLFVPISLKLKQLVEIHAYKLKEDGHLWYPSSFSRCDWIRTSGLCVPNAALYQTEPRIDCCRISYSKSYYICNQKQCQCRISFLFGKISTVSRRAISQMHPPHIPAFRR